MSEQQRYFAAWHDAQVWGLGHTKEGALEDAFMRGRFLVDGEVIVKECTRRLFERVRDFGQMSSASTFINDDGLDDTDI